MQDKKLTKVPVRLVRIRLYCDYIIREIRTFLLRVESSFDGMCISFNIINTPGKMSSSVQRRIHISNDIKYDIVELKADEVESGMMAEIFRTGYHETTNYPDSNIVIDRTRKDVVGERTPIKESQADAAHVDVPQQKPPVASPFLNKNIEEIAEMVQRRIATTGAAMASGLSTLTDDDEAYDSLSGLAEQEDGEE